MAFESFEFDIVLENFSYVIWTEKNYKENVSVKLKKNSFVKRGEKQI